MLQGTEDRVAMAGDPDVAVHTWQRGVFDVARGTVEHAVAAALQYRGHQAKRRCIEARKPRSRFDARLSTPSSGAEASATRSAG